MGLLSAASSHQTKPNNKKLTSTGFKQQRICTPLAQKRNKIIYKTACSLLKTGFAQKGLPSCLSCRHEPQSFCWHQNIALLQPWCKKLQKNEPKHGPKNGTAWRSHFSDRMYNLVKEEKKSIFTIPFLGPSGGTKNETAKIAKSTAKADPSEQKYNCVYLSKKHIDLEQYALLNILARLIFQLIPMACPNHFATGDVCTLLLKSASVDTDLISVNQDPAGFFTSIDQDRFVGAWFILLDFLRPNMNVSWSRISWFHAWNQTTRTYLSRIHQSLSSPFTFLSITAQSAAKWFPIPLPYCDQRSLPGVSCSTRSWSINSFVHSCWVSQWETPRHPQSNHDSASKPSAA